MITITVPSTPTSIPGIPTTTYPTWRPGQREAVQRILDSPSRYVHVHGAPGSGKTLANMAVAGLTPGRVLYLTNTRPLVYQLSTFGMAKVEGRANYPCGDPDKRTCEEFKGCRTRKARRCPYDAAVINAQRSRRVVTNYSYNAHAGEALGDFDLVICDEAHNIEGWVSNWLEFEVQLADVERCGIRPPERREDWYAALPTIEHFLRELLDERRAELRRVSDASRFAWKLSQEVERLDLTCRRLAHIYKTKWICTALTSTVATFAPDDVSIYAARKVWRSARKVVLSSASLLPSTLTSLGLDGEVDRVDLPSTFDYLRRPILYVDDKPKVRIGRKTSEAGYGELARRIVHICEHHAEHKGLILSHSYTLNKRLANLPLRARLLTHKQGEAAPIGEYRLDPSPRILLSPAINEGVDLPYDACRFIIWPRVPFANHTDVLVAARAARIPSYVNDLAAVSFIQGTDRGMRAPDDWCVVYVLDANWTWWRRKVRWPREVGDSICTTNLGEIARGRWKICS